MVRGIVPFRLRDGGERRKLTEDDPLQSFQVNFEFDRPSVAILLDVYAA
jgi:hypothetical protein